MSHRKRSRTAVRSRMILIPAKSSANGPKGFNTAQSANGIAIEVIAVIDRGRRRREQMMLAVNKNRAARDVYQSGGRVNGVNRVSRRFEQLNCARSHLCDRHNKPFSI